MEQLNRWLLATTGIPSWDSVSFPDMREAVGKVYPESERAWQRGIDDALAGLRYGTSHNICVWLAKHRTPKRGKSPAQKIVRAYREIEATRK